MFLKIPFLATRNVANESLKQNGCAQANHCSLRKERTPTSKITVSIGFRRQQLHLQLICTADTLLQKQNSFPSMDGNGAPQSVDFVDIG